MKKITYYPGCTLHSTAYEYGDSTEAVLKYLGIEWQEIPDWNCCGAASAKSLNHKLSILLPARNIKNASTLNNDIYVPCAGCYNNMMKAKRALENAEERQNIEKSLGKFESIPEVYPLMRLFTDKAILEKLSQSKLKTDVKVASYYGCAFVRPEEVLQNENPEIPQSIDNILNAVGLETVEWPLKSFCCGGDLSLADSSVVSVLVEKIINYAKEAGANAIVTACPLCQANLEMRQKEPFPIFYFTEILGIAMGIDNEKWWKKHLVDPRDLVSKIKGGK
ncbi:MAG: CoB--CoM heterodisulfide reductase iron-sulfur subunit B family protein [Proteobacteria bacterium]|nr:CoB--CoM heterodisulfide reductase iron-sulfur subunit B family protein [Pseudomonadota bacterium]